MIPNRGRHYSDGASGKARCSLPIWPLGLGSVPRNLKSQSFRMRRGQDVASQTLWRYQEHITGPRLKRRKYGGFSLLCKIPYPSAIVLFCDTIRFRSRRQLRELASLARTSLRVRQLVSIAHTASLETHVCIATFSLLLGAASLSLVTLEIVGLRDPLHCSLFESMSRLSTITHLKFARTAATR